MSPLPLSPADGFYIEQYKDLYLTLFREGLRRTYKS
jgi:hypothetical protein